MSRHSIPASKTGTSRGPIGRRVLGALLFCGLAAAAPASCSSDEPLPSDDEGDVCPEELADEAQVIQNAAAAFRTYVDRHLSAATPGCVAIIEDLGGNPPNVAPKPTADDLGAACQAARQIVITEIMDQAIFSIDIPDVPCPADAATQDACELACGFGPSCDQICPAKATLETVCAKPMVTVDAATVFKATLEQNLPDIAPLAKENPSIQSATALLTSAFTAVLGDLDGEPLCGAERDAVAAVQVTFGPTQTEHVTAAATVANLLAALKL